MNGFLEKVKNPYFWAVLGVFGRARAQKKILSKIRLRHFSIFTMTNHHTKNQKNPMNGFWDFCVRDGRTETTKFIGQLANAVVQ